MSTQLDLDDVAAQSPLAQRELAELRADAKRMFEALQQVNKLESFFGYDPYYGDIRQDVLKQVRAATASHKEQT